MALVECPDCGRKISEYEPRCPVCLCQGPFTELPKYEDPHKVVPSDHFHISTNNSKFAAFGVIILVAVGAALLPPMFEANQTSTKTNQEPPVQTTKNIPSVGQLCKTKGHYLFSANPDDLKKAEQLVNDKIALAKFIREGRAGILQEGQRVYYDDDKWPAMIKIRPEGETEGVWVSCDAIEPL